MPVLTSLALVALLLFCTGPLAGQAARLGTVAFPNSGSKAAQGPFIRGVLLLHSFEYEDAAAAFREAQRADPGFALAYWQRPEGPPPPGRLRQHARIPQTA